MPFGGSKQQVRTTVVAGCAARTRTTRDGYRAFVEGVIVRIIGKKIPLFGPSLIHQLRLLGSQQHPKIGVLLTSFSTWGTENGLAEINLESTGVIKGCNFFGVKNWQTLAALWAGALSCNRKKSREQTAAGRTR